MNEHDLLTKVLGELRSLRSHLDTQFHRIKTQGEKNMVATQADIDAVTASLTDLGNKLTADDSAIQTEIASLQAAGVDVTNLQAAVTALSTDVDNTAALVPAAPVTPPTGA